MLKHCNHKTAENRHFSQDGRENCAQSAQCHSERGETLPARVEHHADAIFETLCVFFIVWVRVIDGLHTFEQSLKDFYNAWEVLNKGGAVVFHDTIPRIIKNTQRVSKTADSGVVMFTGPLLGCIQ